MATDTFFTASGALFSHWRRHPVQLISLVLGLVAATAMWSGVQALNAHARISYAAAENQLGALDLARLVRRDGAPFTLADYNRTRRAGYAVSPLVEGHIIADGRTFRLLGVEPLSLPVSSALAGLLTPPTPVDDRANRAFNLGFITPPFQLYAAPADRQVLSANAMTLPPILPHARLLPGLLISDIAAASTLLKTSGINAFLLPLEGQVTAEDITSVLGVEVIEIAPPETLDMASLTKSFHLNLTAFGLLSFLVGLFIAYGATGLSFEDRRPLLRTLRCCGVSTRMLAAVLVSEVLIFAMGAGAMGLALGYGLADQLLAGVNTSLATLYRAPVSPSLKVDSWWVASGLMMSAGGALLSAVLVIWRGATIRVAASHQAAMIVAQARKQLLVQALAGMVAAMVAVFALGFGKTLLSAFLVMAGTLLAAALLLPVLMAPVLTLLAHMAKGPVMRWIFADARVQLSGFSLALMALLLALGANIGVGAMVKGFRLTFDSFLEERLAAELYVSAPSRAMAQELTAWLDKRSDVAAVLPSASGRTSLEGWPVEVVGFEDHSTYRDRWSFLDALPDTWDRVAAGTAVLVNEQLARRMGLWAGDSLTINTAMGPWTRAIAGVYADYGNISGQVRAQLKAVLHQFPAARPTALSVRTHSPDSVAKALQARFDIPPERMINQQDLKAFSRGVFERTFAITLALNTLTLSIAGLAIFSSLLTLAASRLPSLAPLWAMGLTRRHLAGLDLVKTLLLAGFTALLALPLGMAIDWIMVSLVNVRAFGWQLPFGVFSADWLRLSLLALGVAAVAGAYPAYRLMRTSPARLIKVFSDAR